MTSEIYFLKSFIENMNDNSFPGKISLICFYFVNNVKGNWIHLTYKNSQTGAKINSKLMLS